MNDLEFLSMVKKLIESNVNQNTLYEIVKTFINDLSHEIDPCQSCESENRYND